MKTKQLLLTGITCLFCCNLAFAQGGAPDEKQAAMEKAWMAFMTPGDIHKMIAASDGDWNEEITMWMDPAAPPTKTTATCTNSMIMDGRYQQSIHKGEYNGMPFHGMSIWGYNNGRKMFESTWIDNMGTGVMFMEGVWDEKSKTATMKGKNTDPVTGKTVQAREIFRFIDDNTQMLEMYETRDGKEMKTMEIKFTRKK